MWRQVVAQSPGENAPGGEVLRYDVGWKALNTMLKTGRSLSGKERNCAFLNTGGSRFADVSQSTGLDFDDDGRVVAPVDWDGDGDLDLWIANRTAPQVRFMRNNSDGVNQFVQFRLRGKGCNRDAIGARIEMKLKGEDTPRMQTVSSGRGYLSHQSKWLHFGLGSPGKGIESISVVWPHGVRESIQAVASGQRYLIVEGSGEAIAAGKKRPKINYTPEEIEVVPVTDQARIVLIQPLPIPNMSFQDSEGERKPVISPEGKPRLITVWASWCPFCMAELEEWKESAGIFERAGVEVVAVNLEAADGQENAGKVYREKGFPFAMGFGGEKLGEQFDVIQRAILSRQRPLPLPSSFLIDGKGQLSVIYKGPVSPEQVAEDVTIIGAPLKGVLESSTPFPGRWLGIPTGSSPNTLAIRFAEGGYTDEAERYLKRLTTEGTDNPVFSRANAFVLLGAILLDRNRLEEAAVAFQQTLDIDPHHRQSAIELAGILVRLNRPKEAVSYYLRALERRGDDPELHFKLALAYLRTGDGRAGEGSLRNSLTLRPSALAHYNLGNVLLGGGRIREAMGEYSSALELDEHLIPAANNLAWLLSTQSDESLRDGKRAVELAEKICDVPAHRSPSSLDTLAVAYAEAGRYDEAVKVLREAIGLSKNPAEAKGLKDRLVLFKSGKPHRDQ